MSEKKAKKIERKRLKLIKVENTKKDVLKSHLQREIKYTKESDKQFKQDWEQLCISFKLPDAKHELKLAAQYINQALDVKTHYIECLEGYRAEAEAQYRRNANRHSDFINYLLDLFNLFMQILKEFYEKEANIIISQFQFAKHDKNSIHSQRKIYYENVLFATNLMTTNYLETIQRNFILDKDELNTKSIEYRSRLTAVKLNEVNLQMINMGKYTEKHQTITAAEQKLYNKLLQKDLDNKDLFDQMKIKIKKLQRIIANLNTELTTLEVNYTQNILDLKHENDMFKHNFKLLKRNYVKETDHDRKQMRTLAARSDEAIKQLEKHKIHGEHIINCAAYTLKYQKEHEKILPWDQHEKTISTNLENEDLTNIIYLPKLKLFMHKVSSADYDNKALENTKNFLQNENNYLNEILRKFCHNQTYNNMIASLRINQMPASMVPEQEAAHMSQICTQFKNLCNHKFLE